jgi:WD40 repeat protein
MSSTICPQLKHTFFADSQQKIADKIGQEILALTVYEERDKPKHDPDLNRYIIAAGNSGRIYFIKMFTYEHQDYIKAHDDSINALLIDENILFSGSHDKTIKLWSLEDKSLLTFIDGSEAGVRSLSIIR